MRKSKRSEVQRVGCEMNPIKGKRETGKGDLRARAMRRKEGGL